MDEGSGFENRRRVTAREFESHTLRHFTYKTEVTNMEETALETVAVGFLEFLSGTLGRIISTFVWWWIMYVLIRFFLQNIVFKNDTDGLNRFSESIKSGLNELAVAFCNTMSGAASIAIKWADEKKKERF